MESCKRVMTISSQFILALAVLLCVWQFNIVCYTFYNNIFDLPWPLACLAAIWSLADFSFILATQYSGCLYSFDKARSCCRKVHTSTVLSVPHRAQRLK